jgi:hypothetical protein
MRILSCILFYAAFVILFNLAAACIVLDDAVLLAHNDEITGAVALSVILGILSSAINYVAVKGGCRE